MAKRILLEIDSEAFARLLASQKLSLMEFSCLDNEAKQQVHDIYLSIVGQQFSAYGGVST